MSCGEGAIALVIERLISSIRYTEQVLNPAGLDVISQTAVMSGQWRVAVVVMVIFIMLMGTLATSFLWDATNIESQSHQEVETRKQTEKIKRERRERIARLLETMDDDDLSALEENQITDDGEIVSVQEMLKGQTEEARYHRQ